MARRLLLASVLGLCGLILLLPVSAHAQAVYGQVFGTVSDPSGAAVPNAKVTVTSVERGTAVNVASNESGNYTVTHLIPGRYNVSIEAPGFKTFEAKAIQVYADQGSRIDANFAVGGEQQTVTVTSEDVPLIKTDRADVSTTFNERAITELPIFSRNFTQLELLSPGTTRLHWQHASSENPQGSIQIMVNGQHFSGTAYQLDGTENRDPILGIIVINPTLESLTQTTITTQNYDAEFGQAVAAVVTAQTKSGGNTPHGSAFWFRRSDATQARDPFTQSKADPLGNFIPPSVWNQFGGSLGGPIIKNKLFAFGDYQGTRSKVGRSNLINLPAFPSDAAYNDCINGIQCDLSLYTTAPIYDPGVGNSIAPLSRVRFPGNIIPGSRLSPQALALLKLLPKPTLSGIQNNFVGAGSGIFNDNGFNIRIDNQTTAKLHTFGRYSFAQFLQSAPGSFGLEVGGPGVGIDGFGGQSKARNQSIATGFDYALSNTWLTDFRFGFFRYRVNVVPNGLGTTPATDVGIPGLNLGDNFTSGMPAFFIGPDNSTLGNFAFGYGLSDRLNRCNCPLDQQEQQFQFVNNWTKISGNHTFKFGGDVRYAMNLRVPSDAHRAGELTFEPARTEGPDPANPTSLIGGLSLASFLLGDVRILTRYTSTVTDAAERQKRMFYYAQDTWRVTPKFTFNYGLRWEIYFPQTVNGPGRGGFVDPTTGLVRVAGVGNIPTNFGVDNNFHNFAPRLGIAYQFTPKTVIRIGYGRSFDIGVFGSIFGHSVTQNLPVLARQEVRGPGGNNFEAAFNLAQGPPAFVFPTVPDSGVFPLCQRDPVTGVGINCANQFIQTQRITLPTLDAWNVSLQHEISPTLTGEVAYVGNKGTHVFPGNGPDFNCNQSEIAAPGDTRSQNERRPFFAPFGWTQDLRCHLNNAGNNYNSLQAKLNKRFSAGLQFQGSYTWQKGLNYGGDNADFYLFNPHLNYGLDDFNRKHVFVISATYELPIGRGKRLLGGPGIASRLLGGWQLNTAIQLQSGLPFSPTYNNCGADRDSGPCRPNLVGSVNYPGTRSQWFETAGVLDPATHPSGLNPGETVGPWQRPLAGTFGTAGRNSLIGPHYFNTDLSIFKNFLITERIRSEFRAEAYNLFNEVQLGNPNRCIDCDPAQNGVISSLAPGASMRRFQFGLRLMF